MHRHGRALRDRQEPGHRRLSPRCRSTVTRPSQQPQRSGYASSSSWGAGVVLCSHRPVLPAVLKAAIGARRAKAVIGDGLAAGGHGGHPPRPGRACSPSSATTPDLLDRTRWTSRHQVMTGRSPGVHRGQPIRTPRHLYGPPRTHVTRPVGPARQRGPTTVKRTSLRRGAPVAMALAVALGLAACGGSSAGSSGDGGSGLSGAVRVDGSSTVAPLSTVAAELFQEANPGVQVTVGTSGHRRWLREVLQRRDRHQRRLPSDQGRRRLPPARRRASPTRSCRSPLDALTVVVNKENTWATCLTTEQLGKIWAPGLHGQQLEPGRPVLPRREAHALRPGHRLGHLRLLHRRDQR